MNIKLIGNPLKHSFSSQLHSMLANYDYQLVDLDKDELESFILAKNYDGLNVTIPYKTDVIKYLDDIDEKAGRINAVNTIVNDKGRLKGYNTDYNGFDLLLKKNGIEVKGKNICILGSGGTSNTIFHYCQDSKANEIVKAHYKGKDGLLSYQQLYNQAERFHILINTTPVGMFPNNQESSIDISTFSNLEAVVDVIYNPLKTKLIVEAQKIELKTATGLYMLVAQAEFASSIFQNRKVDYQKIDDVYTQLLNNKRNIVFIGMPTSGKSTFGKLLAEKLNRNFFDCDDIIQKEEKMTISQIFQTKSEQFFRQKEHEVIQKLSKENSSVIATGGGAVLNSENIDLLRQNGLILLLERDLKLLFCDSSRPTVSSYEKLVDIYNKRYDLYQNSNDIIIVNDKGIDEILNRIMAVIK